MFEFDVVMTKRSVGPDVAFKCSRVTKLAPSAVAEHVQSRQKLLQRFIFFFMVESMQFHKAVS